jgi:hypothetical protein
MSRSKDNEVKVTQVQLESLLNDIKGGIGKRVGLAEELGKKGYSTNLSGLELDLSAADSDVDLSDLNLTQAKLKLPLQQKVDFTNANLTELSVEAGPLINMMRFKNTKLLNTTMSLGDRGKGHVLNEKNGELIDLVIDRSFDQSALISRSEMLETRGVCFGLMMEYARHVMKKQQQGKTEEEFDILEKFHKKTNEKRGSENFDLRVQLYQSNQFKVPNHDITDTYIKNNNFFASLPDEVKSSNIIGFGFNVFDAQGVNKGEHIISVRKIKRDELGSNYEVLESNGGIGKLDSVEHLDKHLAAVLYQYQKNAPLDADKGIRVCDLEGAVHKFGLMPQEGLSQEENKSRKYTIQSHNGPTALQDMLIMASPSPAIIKYLDRVQNIDERDSEGRTALMYGSARGRTDVAMKLIMNGADIDAQDNEGNTALKLSCENNQIKTAEFLVQDCGAKIDGDIEGMPILSWAARNGHSKLAKYLLERKELDVDVQDQNGFTPLMYASVNGHKQVVEDLVNAGAEVGKLDSGGYAALTYAKEAGREEIVAFLEERLIASLPPTPKASKISLGLIKEEVSRSGSPTSVAPPPSPTSVAPSPPPSANPKKRSVVQAEIARINAIEAAKQVGAGIKVKDVNVTPLPPPPRSKNGVER